MTDMGKRSKKNGVPLSMNDKSFSRQDPRTSSWTPITPSTKHIFTLALSQKTEMSQPPHRPDTPIPPRILERRDSNITSSSPEPIIRFQAPTPPDLLAPLPNPDLPPRRSPPPAVYFESLLTNITDPTNALSAILADNVAANRLIL